MNRREFAAALAAAPLITSSIHAEDKPSKVTTTPAETDQEAQQAEREMKFAASLSGATLEGFFTNAGAERKDGLVKESYRLGKVQKLPDGDLWSFEYRYGDADAVIKLPPLAVKWAGDTPVITLTDVGIPGLGTFTARVLFYRGEYCGTWRHDQHGGALFGKIVAAS